jgi:hypothetical protein
MGIVYPDCTQIIQKLLHPTNFGEIKTFKATEFGASLNARF